MSEPKIIQGGMGIGVSGWRLARAVSRLGQMGVVSGTALDLVTARRLQCGDHGGHLRRAFRWFPEPGVAERVLQRYFIDGGKPEDQPFQAVPMPTVEPDVARHELAVLASFAEVWLAKEGHKGLVGMNVLEKIQVPMLPALYGALLAGVDYVLVGAGIPREIPRALEQLARHEEASLKLRVEGASADEEFLVRFRPRDVVRRALQELKRPKFLAIIASATLAVSLARKAAGRIDGFVVEGPTAGGHNAPPRGPLRLNDRGEPMYGPKDEVDFGAIRELGLPFWLAGSYAHPGKLREALAMGAAGVQVGTAFAFCEESDIDELIKAYVLADVCAGRVDVRTDPQASATGFPFKVVQLEETVAEEEVYVARPRVCDLGYLRQPYKKPDGTLGYRCAGEREEKYLKKGGALGDTIGRKCLCNGLIATIGLGQYRRDGYLEPALVTAGEDVRTLDRFLSGDKTSYSAEDVVRYILGGAADS